MRSFQVVNYALALNSYLWTMPDAPSIILYYAIGRESEKIVIRDDDAFKQVIYYFYNNSELLPDCITEEFGEMQDFLDYSDYYRGHDTKGNYCPDEEVDFLSNYCENHPEFLANCRRWYRFYLCFSGEAKFNLQYNSDKFGQFLEYKRYYPTQAVVPTSLPLAMLLEWQTRHTPREIALISMYSAIRSIIGRKKVAATTKAYIFARMFGAKNTEELRRLLKSDKTLKKIADNWDPSEHRKKFDNVLKLLRDRHLINCFGYKRNTYVSLVVDKDEVAKAAAQTIRKQNKTNWSALINKYLDDPP